MKVFTIILFCIGNAVAMSQSNSLIGFVTDRESGEPLTGVTVRVDGTRLGAISDKTGRFAITNVTAGMLTLKATLVGYEAVTTEVFIKSGQNDVVFTMKQTSIRSEEIIISAGQRVQAAQDVPISVSTMSEQDLAARSITRLDDALRYVSGVSLQGDQVNIRGSSGFAFGLGSRTMVLLDGFPVLSGDNGDIKFDVMPVADVERLEIIKGAGSALYGTGALGGVVSMFTKTPTTDLDVQARVYGGLYTAPRYDEWKYRSSAPLQWGADLRASQRFGDWSVNLSAGYRGDESYRQFDRQQRGFGFGKVIWTPDQANRFTIFSLYALDYNQNFIYWKDLPNATRPTDVQDQNEWLWTQKLAAALEWQTLLSSTTSLVIRPGVFQTRFESRIGDVVLDSNQSTAYAYNVDAIVTSTILDWLTVTGGLTGRVNSVRADVYGEQLQTVISGFVQGEFQLPHDVIITAGARVDREETQTLPAQIEVSPKFGASWRATEELTLRGSVGRGFRAATIAERYANIRYGPFKTAPNPDIRPESSWSAELGMHVSTRSLFLPIDLDIAVFDNELFDLIEPSFDFDDPTVPIVFKNLTRARILGTELTVRVALTRSLGVETGVTAMLPTDLTTNETMKYRNSFLWYSRGSWMFKAGPLDLELQAEYRYVSRVENVDERLDVFIVDASERVPSHVVDARLFWDMQSVSGQPIRIGLIGRNLLDYYYNEIVANLAPTRSILLQIEWR